MNCEETKSLLSAYFDGALSAAESDGVVTHLVHCRPCAGQLAGLVELDRKSQLLITPEPPADLWDRISQQLAAGRVHAAPPLGGRTRRRFLFAGAGLAASVVAGLLGLNFVRRRNVKPAPEAQEPVGSDGNDVVLVNLSLLTPEDRHLAESQDSCAADDCKMRLGTDGRPVKVMVNGTPVFCCCQECALWARAHPQEAIAKHNMLVARHQTHVGTHAAP